MRTMLAVVVAGAGLWISTVPVQGHHAFAAEFDVNRQVKFEGTVTKMEWSNPHIWIYVDVKRPNGKVEKWEIEGGAPNGLLRRGWTRNSLPPGTVIRVDGYGARDGSPKANGREITFVDGRTLFVGSPGTGAPDEAAPAQKK